MNSEQLLRNPDIEPSVEVIAKALKDANDSYIKLLGEFANRGIGLKWHYYNDGKAWLAKGQYLRKGV